MIQAPIPPGFVPPPLDWFQFAMLYFALIELVVLMLPERRQRNTFRAAFCLKDSFDEHG